MGKTLPATGWKFLDIIQAQCPYKKRLDELDCEVKLGCSPCYSAHSSFGLLRLHSVEIDKKLSSEHRWRSNLDVQLTEKVI